MTPDKDKILKTAQEVADATGLSRWYIQAAKRYCRGREDSPFSGKFTTQRRFSEWLFRNPDFVASHQFRPAPGSAERPAERPAAPARVCRNSKPECIGSDHRLSAFGKCGAQIGTSAQRMPLPAGLVHQPEQAGR